MGVVTGSVLGGVIEIGTVPVPEAPPPPPDGLIEMGMVVVDEEPPPGPIEMGMVVAVVDGGGEPPGPIEMGMDDEEDEPPPEGEMVIGMEPVDEPLPEPEMVIGMVLLGELPRIPAGTLVGPVVMPGMAGRVAGMTALAGSGGGGLVRANESMKELASVGSAGVPKVKTW